MKSKIYILLLSASMLLVTHSCNQILEEQPRSILVPDFFRTAAGINTGLTAAYAYFRFYYATEGGMNLTVYGTDEFTHGQQTANPPFNIYEGVNFINPALGDLLTPWNRAYPAINTCNGIIDIGSQATDLSPQQKAQLIAEAKFIRANWYFILVQTFGGVTLDLGSGPLRFNTSPTNVAVRATAAEVYQAIISDLEDAVANLPAARPALPGRVWKATALHLLAKVYLTRGSNPQLAQADDIQKAFDHAMDLINNRYGTSLLPDFARVHAEGNENNAEVLWAIQWLDNPEFNDNNGFLGGEAALRQNRSLWFFRCFYHNNMPGLIRDVTNGRPWVRYKPTPWLLDQAFGDKVNDSRYYKSFQILWRCNSTTTTPAIPTWTTAEAADPNIRDQRGARVVAGQPKFILGDTAMFMVPQHLAARFTPVSRKSFRVFLPQEINEQNMYYPSLSKYNSTQPRQGDDPNVSSVRPFIVYRLAETFLLAAEAAHQLGRNTEAANLINVVRERAATTPAHVPAMRIAAANVNIDFILDERARELCGEQMRWFDLVRTGRLIQRIRNPYTLSFNGGAPVAGQGAPNPQPHHLLRPIPQNQIDLAVDPTAADGRYAQNPGY
jgi:hypothetical protein